ncbi:MAG: hypothetical protein ACR2ME_01110 [Acidimicrobiia bacterium]
MNFWDALWPQPWATIAGVVVGFPIALLLNRLAHLRSEASARQSAIDRSDRDLRAVAAVLENNVEAFAQLNATLIGEATRLLSAARSEVWETACSSLIAPASDQTLVLDLTSYFEDVVRFDRDLQLLQSVSVGAGAALDSAVRVRQMLRIALLRVTDDLRVVSTLLARRVREAQTP